MPNGKVRIRVFSQIGLEEQKHYQQYYKVIYVIDDKKNLKLKHNNFINKNSQSKELKKSLVEFIYK